MATDKVKEFKFRDFNVRVWDGDVFINAYKDIEYVDCAGAEALSINTEDEAIREHAIGLCRKISGYFVLLDSLLNEVDAINAIDVDEGGGDTMS